ncbi:MAG: amphi-Trp domain-containing protein [Chloroflexi bacterium]|nr:amphi-Trp domain-containing protein [Chloroflexota bacterium]
MGSDKHTFEFETYSDPAEVADYLEELARNLRAGQVKLASGAESISMRVGSTMKFEVEAEAKPSKGKANLQLELTWKEPMFITGSQELTASAR